MVWKRRMRMVELDGVDVGRVGGEMWWGSC